MNPEPVVRAIEQLIEASLILDRTTFPHDSANWNNLYDNVKFAKSDLTNELYDLCKSVFDAVKGDS